MRKLTRTMNGRKRIMAGILAVITGFMLILPGMLSNTLGDPNYGTIKHFEHGNPAYEKSVDMGTAWDQLELPTSLRAVLEIAEDEITAETVTGEPVAGHSEANEISSDETDAEDASENEAMDKGAPNEAEYPITDETGDENSDGLAKETTAVESAVPSDESESTEGESLLEEPAEQEGFIQATPSGDDADYGRYGYTAPENEEELRAAGRLVIYAFENADGGKSYRIYGTLNGGNEAFYVCDENGSITGFVAEIPVTWNGVYNGNVPGTYNLTAQFENYHSSGEQPAAVITVLPGERKDSQPLLKAPAAKEHIIIPIGVGAPGVGTYKGYTVTFDSGWGNKITFNTGANDYTYEFTYSGSSTAIEDVKFYDFILQTGVDTTITLNSVNCTPYKWLDLQGSAKLTLLLAGTNTVNRNTRVPSGTTLIIDSAAASGSENGSLSTTLNNSNVACIGGVAANSGQIIINGGTLTMTQTGGTSSAAAIGGGQTGSGTVTINGGSVTAKAVDGAAIGGGSGTNGTGNVTIKGGTVNAEIVSSSPSGNGAGIGGGKGGNGNVTISGGTIDVKSVTLGSGGGGAGVGGGQNGRGEVTITGGEITVDVANGAGIGNGAGSSPASGKVNISGGTVRAYSTQGAGVGIGSDNSISACTLNICHTADIITFSNMLTNNGAGICGGGNIGDGYFVNMMYYTGIPVTPDQMMLVYAADDSTAPLRTVPIPYRDFTTFSFTTGKIIPQDFHIYLGTYAGGMKQFVKWNTTDPIIYSVKSMGQYKNDVGTPVNQQRVDFGSGTSFPVRFLITEYHVDMDGKLITSVNPDPREKLIPINTNYNGTYLTPPQISDEYDYKGYTWTTGGNIEPGNPSKSNITGPWEVWFVYALKPTEATVTEKYVDLNGKPIPDQTDTYETVLIGGTYSKAVPLVTGYIGKGHQWDNPPAAPDYIYTPGGASKIIDQDETVYFIYKLDPGRADVTVSKKVTGINGDKTKDFAFTVYVIDDDGNQTTETFTLKHGEAKTFKDIQADYLIKAVETPDNSYLTSFADSGGASGTNDTGYRVVGTDGRVFTFRNHRIAPPPTGISDGNGFMELVLFCSMLLILSGTVVFKIIRKRKIPWSRS